MNKQELQEYIKAHENPQCAKCTLTMENASHSVTRYMDENGMCYRPSITNSDKCRNFRR